MSEKRADFRLRVNQRAFELVRRLASDSEFRARFEQAPAEALAEYGIEIEIPAEAVAELELPAEEELNQVVREAGEPDDLGYVELPLPDEWVLLRILGAMAFVEGWDGEGDHAR